MRINKFLSNAGVCSRRKADTLIREKRVTINGKEASLGDLVLKTDSVYVDGNPISGLSKKLYYAYHKPVGVICSNDEKSTNNILENVNIKERIYPVGRLDVASSGLIFLTNDGEFANRIMHPRYMHEKEYVVEIYGKITESFLEKMQSGVEIEVSEGLRRVTEKAKLFRESDTVFRIILKQGYNRQIRKMCEALSFRVISLKRVRIHTIKLQNLPVGDIRELTKDERLSLDI